MLKLDFTRKCPHGLKGKYRSLKLGQAKNLYQGLAGGLPGRLSSLSMKEAMGLGRTWDRFGSGGEALWGSKESLLRKPAGQEQREPGEEQIPPPTTWAAACLRLTTGRLAHHLGCLREAKALPGHASLCYETISGKREVFCQPWQPSQRAGPLPEGWVPMLRCTEAPLREASAWCPSLGFPLQVGNLFSAIHIFITSFPGHTNYQLKN